MNSPTPQGNLFGAPDRSGRPSFPAAPAPGEVPQVREEAGPAERPTHGPQLGEVWTLKERVVPAAAGEAMRIVARDNHSGVCLAQSLRRLYSVWVRVDQLERPAAAAEVA